MIIVRNEKEIQEAIQTLKNQRQNAKVGFVPTMGALHEGHISLIDLCKKHCEIAVCSIFVNPTQFNNPKDLETYPRTIEEDRQMLEAAGCDILLLPGVNDVYPNGTENYAIDLAHLDSGMEGQFRPNHFKGVCMVVERFFNMVKPDVAFFGKKDFQQLSIIRHMAKVRGFEIEIIGAPIKRALSGLALSSRNALLSTEETKNAALISTALESGLKFAETNRHADAVHLHIMNHFKNSELRVEYVALVDNDTLIPVTEIDQNTTVCIAAYCGNVRLIDNMQFDQIN